MVLLVTSKAPIGVLVPIPTLLFSASTKIIFALSLDSTLKLTSSLSSFKIDSKALALNLSRLLVFITTSSAFVVPIKFVLESVFEFLIEK